MQGILAINGKGALFTADIELSPDGLLHEVMLKSGRKRLRAQIRQADGENGIVDCFIFRNKQRSVAFNLGRVAGKEQVTRTGHKHSLKKGWGKFTNWSCTFTPRPPS